MLSLPSPNLRLRLPCSSYPALLYSKRDAVAEIVRAHTVPSNPPTHHTLFCFALNLGSPALYASRTLHPPDMCVERAPLLWPCKPTWVPAVHTMLHISFQPATTQLQRQPRICVAR